MITEERLDELAIQVSFRSDVDALNIFKLIEEIRRLNKIIAKEVGDKFELGAAYNALKEENQKFRKALEFYADPDHWDNDGICYSDARCLDLKTDEGVVAREALWIKE